MKRRWSMITLGALMLALSLQAEARPKPKTARKARGASQTLKKTLKAPTMLGRRADPIWTVRAPETAVNAKAVKPRSRRVVSTVHGEVGEIGEGGLAIWIGAKRSHALHFCSKAPDWQLSRFKGREAVIKVEDGCVVDITPKSPRPTQR